MSKEHLHPERAQSPEAPKKMFNDPEHQLDNMELKAIAQLAYIMWEERGRPLGSPDDDWFRAEQKLRRSREWVPQRQNSDIFAGEQ